MRYLTRAYFEQRISFEPSFLSFKKPLLKLHLEIFQISKKVTISIHIFISLITMVGLPKKRTKRKRKSELWGPRKKTAAQIAGDNTPDRLEINRIIATKRDYGDRELAFITLGMNSTPNADYILPNVDGFLTLVNALFARLHPTVIDLSPYPNSDKRLVAMRAGQACSRIQMAIRTIGGFQNEFWGARWDGPLIVVNMGDIRPGATWDATNPMSADDLANHVAIVLQQPTSDRYSNYRLHHHRKLKFPGRFFLIRIHSGAETLVQEFTSFKNNITSLELIPSRLNTCEIGKLTHWPSRSIYGPTNHE